MDLKTIERVLGRIKIGNSIEEQSYFNQHQFRYAKTLQLIKIKSIIGKKILDLGTLPGHLPIALKLLGAYEVLGLDYNPNRFGSRSQIENQGIKILECNIETDRLPFENHSVDLVIFTEVIEHLQASPKYALSEIKRVLKLEGILIVTTPNIENLANRIRKLLNKSIYPTPEQTGHLKRQQHHHEYKMNELARLIQEAGFTIQDKTYIGGSEMAILRGTFPTNPSSLLTIPYALIAMFIPQFRSYLFIKAKI